MVYKVKAKRSVYVLNSQTKLAMIKSILLYFLLCTCPCLAFAKMSDFERFQFQDTLKKEVVLFLPIRDLRPLFDQKEPVLTPHKSSNEYIEQTITQLWKPLKNIRILSHPQWMKSQANDSNADCRRHDFLRH